MVKFVIIVVFCFSFILSYAQTEKLKNGTRILTKNNNNTNLVISLSNNLII